MVSEEFLMPCGGEKNLLDVNFPNYVPKVIETVEPLSVPDSFQSISDHPKIRLRRKHEEPYSPVFLRDYKPSSTFQGIRVNDTVFNMIDYYEKGKYRSKVAGITVLRNLCYYDSLAFKLCFLRDSDSFEIDLFEFLQWDEVNKSSLTMINHPCYLSSYGLEIDSMDSYFLNEERLNA